MYKLTKYFPTDEHTKVYTHRMSQLILEGLGIAHSKGLRFTLFSGDEKNILAWMKGLDLTNYECLSSKFQDGLHSTQNPNVKQLKCVDGVQFGSNLLIELFMQNNSYFVNMRYNGKTLSICRTEDTSPVQDCPLDTFKDWVKDTFMLEDFSEFCGSGDANVPDTVALKQDLAFYSFLKFIMMCGCVSMLFVIAIVWFCMGKRNNYERSDFAKELGNFGSNFKLKATDEKNKPTGDYDDQLRSQPTEPAELEPQPLDHIPDFALETENSFEEGGSFRFDKDELKKQKKEKKSAIAVTDTDRRGINESVNQDSYVQNRVRDSPEKTEDQQEAVKVDYGDEENAVGEEI